MPHRFQAARQYIIEHYIELLIPLGVLLITVLAGYLLRALLFRTVRRWAVKSNSSMDVLITQTLSGPILIWSVILGLEFAVQTSDIPPHAEHFITKNLIVLWIISFTLMASRFAGNFVTLYGNRVAGNQPVASLSRNLTQLCVSLIGVLMVLHALSINITPILTALGVGGLAVALALQDTLSNLFGGFYISVAGQVRLGDYIKLSSGEEGFVTDISWRSTTIRGLTNNMVIIPNSKLAQAIVTNYSLPEKRMSISLTVGVGYGSDPDQVERLLLEECLATAKNNPGLLTEPAPNVLLSPGFGDSALQFSLNCQIAEFTEQFRVQHELRKNILKRFRREGIEMPFPTRTLYLHNEPNGKPAER